MVKRISWRRTLPVLGIGLLGAGLMTFVGGNTSTSAHNRGDWNNDTKYFLKLSGIAGASTENKHQGEIELNAYRIMEDEPDVQAADEKTELSDLGDNNMRIIADSSKASPALFAKAASGDKIAEAVLTVRKGGKTSDYLTIKMTDVIVSNYQNSGNDKNDSVDEVVFDYASITMEHNEGTPFKKGWDFRNKKEVQ
jgi:type VI secretion system secreted protein Hcp